MVATEGAAREIVTDFPLRRPSALPARDWSPSAPHNYVSCKNHERYYMWGTGLETYVHGA